MARIIDAFIKPNLKYKFLPEEDSFRYNEDKNRLVVAVADGITRDPVGIEDFPKEGDIEGVKRVISLYPKPSPAKISADLFCEKFVEFSEEERDVQAIALRCNRESRKLNEDNNPNSNYLDRDYWACVASFGIIENSELNYGLIGDCGIVVLDKSGKVKFQATPTLEDVDEFVQSQEGYDWNKGKWRRWIRSELRNKQHFVDGRLIAYGAFTGEDGAKEFVKTGRVKLDLGDVVAFYSDGFYDLVKSQEFATNLDNLKELSMQYEKEGTIVLVKY